MNVPEMPKKDLPERAQGQLPQGLELPVGRTASRRDTDACEARPEKVHDRVRRKVGRDIAGRLRLADAFFEGGAQNLVDGRAHLVQLRAATAELTDRVHAEARMTRFATDPTE